MADDKEKKTVVDLDEIPPLALPEEDDGKGNQDGGEGEKGGRLGKDDTVADDKGKKKTVGYSGTVPRLVLPDDDDGEWDVDGGQGSGGRVGFRHRKQSTDEEKEGEKRKARPAEHPPTAGDLDHLMPPPTRLKLRLRPQPPPNYTAMKNMRMQQQERRTFDFMIDNRTMKFAFIMTARYPNALKLPVPWTIPTWEQALQYEVVIERYHELEYRINDWLADQLYELRRDLTGLPLSAPKGTRAAQVVKIKMEQLDRVIMRCRLSDATRAFDMEHGTCPHRIPEETDMLLDELLLREEREVRETIEQNEREVREAIQILDEIGEEAAAQEENVPPIMLSGFESVAELLKRWPEWKNRFIKVSRLEEKKFPKRYLRATKGR